MNDMISASLKESLLWLRGITLEPNFYHESLDWKEVYFPVPLKTVFRFELAMFYLEFILLKEWTWVNH